MWTVEQAKSELVDLLRRVDAGEPQVIDGGPSYVVIPMADYERLNRTGNTPHLGRWLVENAPRIGDIDLAPSFRGRPVPFDHWTDEELAE